MRVRGPLADREGGQNRRDRGALAVGIFRLFLGLFVGAIVFWIVQLVADPLLNRAGNSATDATSNQGTQFLQEGIGYIPILFLGICFFGLIAYSVYSREVVR